MKVIVCDNQWQNKWDEFVKNNSSDFGLLQSWRWGEFQENLGKKVFRLAIIENDEILVIAQLIKMPLKLGKSYFYIPRGPVINRKFKVESQKVLGLLFFEIKSLAKKESVVFLRFDPALLLCLSDTSPHKGGQIAEYSLLSKGQKFVGQVQPKQTLVLDLDKSEEKLLSEMKSKTRYNIKVAQKHEVEIDQGSRYFEDFWRLTEKTSSRQEIVSHQKDYYRKMVESLGDSVRLIVVKYQDKVVVANIVIFFGDWCVYLHGASDYEYRNIMAPFLLQWETIKLAKKEEKKYYDFWGVDREKWPGVTRFKSGFGKDKEFTKYIGAWDEVYSKFWYNIYRLFRRK